MRIWSSHLFPVYYGTVSRRTVPMNVDFAIHRFGEWIMLMLGESVLSLLIVDIVDTTGYHQTFLCGIFSIVLLQYLHFQSAPSEPDQHAIRRSVTSSFYFYVLFQIYSLSLIVLGVSYKMLLLESVHVEVSSSSSGNSSSRHRLFERDLAVESSTTNLSSASERQQNIADLFSGSLAVIFFCLDAMSLVHRGVKTQMHQCECVNTIKKKILLVALSAGRVVLTVFVATVSQFETDPRRVALIGTLVILGQVCVRLVGGYVFHSSDMREQIAMERVIHYNTSRIHARPEYMDSVRSSGR